MIKAPNATLRIHGNATATDCAGGLRVTESQTNVIHGVRKFSWFRNRLRGLISRPNLQLLSGLLVSCTCGERVSNGNFAAHARGECNTSVTVSAQSTVHDVLSKPKDSPLTPLEMELQTTLAKRSLATSPEQCLLQMKTGGQVYQLKSINT